VTVPAVDCPPTGTYPASIPSTAVPACRSPIVCAYAHSGFYALLSSGLLFSGPLSCEVAVLRPAVVLRVAAFRPVVFRRAVLRAAVLRPTVLRAAVLRVALLRAAVLRPAVLRAAVLRVALLRTVDFRPAVLRVAALRGVFFRAPVLRGRPGLRLLGMIPSVMLFGLVS
jgi:hypothetical protein